MGRIKTRQVKAATLNVYDKHGEEFGKDFISNKQVVAQKLNTSSKKLRNIIAGYATRLKKAEKK